MKQLVARMKRALLIGFKVVGFKVVGFKVQATQM